MSPTVGRCWLAPYSAKPCDGPTDKAHLIPKQAIKRDVGTDPAVVWHPSVVRPACRRHHGDFDARMLCVPRSAVPAATERYAMVFGLGSRLDRLYGPQSG